MNYYKTPLGSFVEASSPLPKERKYTEITQKEYDQAVEDYERNCCSDKGKTNEGASK